MEIRNGGKRRIWFECDWLRRFGRENLLELLVENLVLLDICRRKLALRTKNTYSYTVVNNIMVKSGQ